MGCGKRAEKLQIPPPFYFLAINELVVLRLLDILQAEYLHYLLLYARLRIDGKEIKTYITRTENFRRENERKMPLDFYYDLHKKDLESPLDFCLRMGWGDYVYRMLSVDYLVCNRDRHGANIELLIDDEGNVRPAPLFDHGVSLLFFCFDDLGRIRRYDVMEDKAVNNFIGSKSWSLTWDLSPKGKYCSKDVSGNPTGEGCWMGWGMFYRQNIWTKSGQWYGKGGGGMYKFAVLNKACADKTVAYLFYDESSRTYRIEVPENVKSTEAPPIIADFIEKGERHIGHDWSLRWVKQRVIPSDRQNIGQILRENGMEYYDESPLLLNNQGRCCQDECYLAEI